MATTLAVTFSVLVIRLHFKSAENRPPQWLRILLFNYMARLVCMDYHGKYSRLIMTSKKKSVQRDLTWSDTITEDIRSQNSHAGTLSPGPMTPDGPDEIELLHHRRRLNESGYPEHNSGQLRDQSTSHESHVYEHHHHPSDAALHASHPILINEWKHMAEILDRFFFWLFLFFLIIPTTTILGFVRLFKPAL